MSLTVSFSKAHARERHDVFSVKSLFCKLISIILSDRVLVFDDAAFASLGYRGFAFSSAPPSF